MERENLDKYMVFIEDEAAEIRRATHNLALQLALCSLAAWIMSAVFAVVTGLLLGWSVGVIIAAGVGLALVFGYILSICWLRDLDDRRRNLRRSRD